MLNWFLSILVHKEVITVEEARHLAQELSKTIHEHNFTDAHKTVGDILNQDPEDY